MRKVLISTAAALVVVSGAVALRSNYACINRTFYPRTTEVLNLSGQKIEGTRGIARLSGLKQADLRGTGISAEDYAYIQQALPDCNILWELPFQGRYYSLDTQEISVDTLSERDVYLLDYLPLLTRVDAVGCSDYAQLAMLQEHHPDCTVTYTVPLAGALRNSNTAALKIENPDADELLDMLCYLPKLQKLHLTGKLPETETLRSLMETYPGIAFSCDMHDRELPLGPNAQKLDLSEIQLTMKQTQTLLSLCPNLKKAKMLDCGLSDKQMMSLADQYPDCFFVWELEVASVPVRTDAEEMDLSYNEMEDTKEVESKLRYFPNLKKVIMCDCGICNEDMDALNKRYDDIRFVWMIHCGRVDVRTDADYFAPVVTGSFVYQDNLKDLHYCTDIVAIDIGHMYVTSCEWAASMPNLQYLIIADTQIADISPLAGLKNLIFLEMFLTPVRDYSPLLGCTGLEDLNLCYTFGDPEPIRQMTWLKRLWWDGNYLATQGLEADLPDTETNFHSGSSTGGTWRGGNHYKEQRDILGMPYFYG